MKAKEKKLSGTFFRIMFLWLALCFLLMSVFTDFTIHPLSDDTDKLIWLLENGTSGSRRKDAAEALGEIKDKRAVDALIHAMENDEGWYVREPAARALGKIKNKRAMEALIHALENDNERDVRREAAEVLGKIKDKRAVDALILALNNDDDSRLRQTAAIALGKLKDKRAVDVLILALNNDTDNEVRQAAAEALGKLEDRRVVDALIHALENHTDADVRCLAVNELKGMKDIRAVEALLGILEDEGNKEAECVIRKGWKKLKRGNLFDAAWRALGDEATEALRETNNSCAVDLLMKIFRNAEDGESRVAAGLILLNIGEIPPDDLVAIFEKEDIRLFVRAMVGMENDRAADMIAVFSEALKETKNPRVVDLLMKIFRNEEDSRNRAGAGLVLLNMGEISVDELFPVLRLRKKYDHLLAHVMRRMENDHAVDMLAALLEKGEHWQDWRTREIIAKSLGHIGSARAAEVLTEMLKNEKEYEVLKQIVESLTKIKKYSAPNFFLGLLNEDDPGLRRGAVIGLGLTGEPRSVIKPLILAWMRDSDEKVRQYARGALFD